jgi:hypothetical protein
MKKTNQHPDREDLIRRYKTILQQVVDRRPSGIRLKIAEGIGRNKSFISQITNPNYDIPVPRRHLPLIFDLAHFTAEEKSQFLNYYRRAHPRVGARAEDHPSGDDTRIVRLQLPRLESTQMEAKVDNMLRDFAHRLSELLRAK